MHDGARLGALSARSLSTPFLPYGLSYLVVGYSTNLAMAFVGSFIVGAAMSVAMGQVAYLISVAVDKNSTSMALVLAVICLAGHFQKHLVQFAS